MSLRDTAVRWRQQRDALHTRLFPTLPRPLLEAAARAVGLADPDGQITYSRPEHVAACTDLVAYALPEGRPLLAQALAQQPDLDPLLRDALLQARYALLEVTAAAHPALHGDGAEVRDLRTGTVGVLADPQIGHIRMMGAHVAAHVLEGPGFWITTGAPLRVDAELVRRALARPDLDGAALVATVTRSQWSLAPAPAPAPAAARLSRRPGRNDPCPCGSGRSYRRCHGQRR